MKLLTLEKLSNIANVCCNQSFRSHGFLVVTLFLVRLCISLSFSSTQCATMSPTKQKVLSSWQWKTKAKTAAVKVDHFKRLLG